MGTLRLFITAFLVLILMGCSTFFKTDKLEEVKSHEEFDKMLEVKVIEPPPEQKKPDKIKSPEKTKKATPKKEVKKKTEPKKKKAKPKSQPKSRSSKKLKKHEPEIEDSVGFDGRRPIVDPYAVGEKVVLELSYLNMTAGNLNFETRPYVEVNGHKAYHFFLSIKSSKVFAFFYKLNNSAETFVDYEKLIPYSHAVHIKESKQIKESRSFYDWKTLKGRYWENKVTDDGEKKKKKEWDLKPYSHNLISALFYIRTFTFEVGKIIRFYVADAGKQITLKGTVLRKEKIKVPAGEFDTHVVKIEYKVGGTFKQIGEVLFWFTNDKYKHLVKIKSKIKIGSINGEAIKRVIPKD